MEKLWQDIRLGLSGMVRCPLFTVVAVITLAAGVGATIAMFSVTYGVLLRPLPYAEADRLVMLYAAYADQPDKRWRIALGTYGDWAEQSHSFERLAAFTMVDVPLTAPGEPVQLRGAISVGSLFDVLGVEPAAGRTFAASEDMPGGNRIVVLSHRLATRLFGTPGVAPGKTVTIAGGAFAVVGVMRSDFQFPDAETDFWIPARYSEARRADRTQAGWTGLGRLAGDTDLPAARGELELILARQRAMDPDLYGGLRTNVVSLRDEMLGEVRGTIWILMAAAVTLLLVACANLANLLLARAAERRGEMSVRRALGATHGRIVRQLVTESFLLAAVGTTAGLILGYGLLKALPLLSQSGMPRADGVGFGVPVCVFSAGVALGTGLLFGVLPATSGGVQPAVARGRGTGAKGRGRVRHGMVVAQFALSFLLLTGGGLLIRSVELLNAVDPGVRTEHVLTFSMAVPRTDHPDPGERVAFFEEAVRRIESLPGIESAGIISTLPVDGYGIGASLNILDRPAAPGSPDRIVAYRVVSPGYFRTMGVGLQRGRFLEAGDDLEAPAVVVNETLASAFFPGEAPLGRVVRLGPEEVDLHPPARIVGVVENVRHMGLDGEDLSVVYVPHAVMPWKSEFGFTTHTTGDPDAAASRVRVVVQALAPAVPIQRLRTMREIIGSATVRQRAATTVLLIFAGAGALLAAVGVFGLLAYTVSRERGSIAVRMAVGASPRDVLGLVLIWGMGSATMGILLGVGGALALTRFMSGLLFGVSPNDPLTFALVSVALAGVALLATWIPARQAARVDPMVTLKEEG